MTSPVFWLVAIIAGIAIAIAAVLILPQPPSRGDAPLPGTDVSVNAGGSIVTVRKVGRMTSVTIRGIHDHWEGDEAVTLPPTPIEATRREETELYNEYMSPSTSATRKYEIADELYAMGYSLPLIPGLIEQWKREQEELKAFRDKGGDARTVLEPTPPIYPKNLTRGGAAPKGLDLDESLLSEAMPDMSEAEEEPHPENPGSPDY